MTLQEQDLPGLYKDGNDNSLEAQERFLKWTWRGLIAVIVAAAAGAVSVEYAGADVGGIVAAISFLAAVYFRVLLLKDGPEKVWYDGRAVAESTKTTAWRYATGGKPFGLELTEEEADKRFVQRLREIPQELDPRSIVPTSDILGEDITGGMRNLRKLSLQERKDAYRDGRIRDQREWYARKAKWNKTRANFWSGALIIIELFGVGGAVLKAANVVDVGLLGFAGALVAAGTSWLQTKQHANLAEAYAVTAKELSHIDTLLPSCAREEDWADFVGQSEEAISREHTLWVASRTSSRALTNLYRNPTP